MIGRVLLLIIAVAQSTPAQEARFVFADRDAHAHASARFETNAEDSSTLAVTFADSPGQFEIPVGVNRVVSAGASSSLLFIREGMRHRIYQPTPAAMEWEVELDSAPSSNRIVLSLATEHLEFCYQPPLSLEEIAEGAERPDSVVGSYAVYHCAGAAGVGSKAFHIYRPRAWDSKGDTVWCGLMAAVEDSELIVDIPPRFMASAVYPVTIDPTFGFSSEGASTIPMLSSVCYANVYDTHIASAGDRVVQFHVYLRAVGGGSVGMAIYSMTNGVPVNRVASPVTVATPNSGDVVLHSSTTVSQSLTSNEQYCVAMGAESGDIRFAYDTAPDGLSLHTSSGSLPTTWTEGETANRRLSIFVTYEEEQSAIPPLPTRRRKLSAAPR